MVINDTAMPQTLPCHPLKKNTINTTDTPYSIMALAMPKRPNLFTSFRLRTTANNCSLAKIKKAKKGIMKTKEGGSWNFFSKASRNTNSTAIPRQVRINDIKKLAVKEILNSSFDFLKKSAPADCIIPRHTKGAMNIRLLENKLSMPLSLGER